MFTQASNGVVPTKSHVQPKSEPLDNASSVSSEQSTIADIVEDAESDEEDNVDEEDEDDYFWPFIYQRCEVKDEDHFL